MASRRLKKKITSISENIDAGIYFHGESKSCIHFSITMYKGEYFYVDAEKRKWAIPVL